MGMFQSYFKLNFDNIKDKQGLPILDKELLSQLKKLEGNQQKLLFGEQGKKLLKFDAELGLKRSSESQEYIKANKAKKTLIFLLNKMSDNQFCPEIVEHCKKEKSKYKELSQMKKRERIRKNKLNLLDKLEIDESSLNNKKRTEEMYNNLINDNYKRLVYSSRKLRTKYNESSPSDLLIKKIQKQVNDRKIKDKSVNKSEERLTLANKLKLKEETEKNVTSDGSYDNDNEGEALKISKKKIKIGFGIDNNYKMNKTNKNDNKRKSKHRKVRERSQSIIIYIFYI